MPEKEFENQVQETLVGFRMPPSPRVWEEVEKQIRRKKRRRILFFWLLAGGLALGGGAWWLKEKNGQWATRFRQDYGGQAGNKQGSLNAEVAVKDRGTEGKGNAPYAMRNKQGSMTGEADLKDRDNQEKGQGAPRHRQGYVGLVGNKQGGSEKKRTESVTPDRGGRQDRAKQSPVTGTEKGQPALPAGKEPQEKMSVKSPFAEAENITVSDEGKPPSPSVPAGEAYTGATDPELAAASGFRADSTAKQEVGETTPAGTDLSVTETLTRKKKKRFQWEKRFTLAVGPARLSEARADWFAGTRELLSFQSDPFSGSPTVGYADSVALTGNSWTLGMDWRRDLGKRISFSLGAQFTTYSLGQRVGVYVDSARSLSSMDGLTSVSGFFRAGSLQEYRNRYFFLELPLLFHWQFNRGERLPPLRWYNGLAPSFLLGSRALVYNRAAHVFYKDASLYNRFQLQFQGGVTALLLAEKKHPLEAGIYYRFHWSALQGKEQPRFNYLGGYGLQLRWTWKK